MKYKDLGKVLSKDEMKGVKGGVPRSYWSCGSGSCFYTYFQCSQNCDDPQTNCRITAPAGCDIP